jgi:hypothetical protein
MDPPRLSAKSDYPRNRAPARSPAVVSWLALAGVSQQSGARGHSRGHTRLIPEGIKPRRSSCFLGDPDAGTSSGIPLVRFKGKISTAQEQKGWAGTPRDPVGQARGPRRQTWAREHQVDLAAASRPRASREAPPAQRADGPLFDAPAPRFLYSSDPIAHALRDAISPKFDGWVSAHVAWLPSTPRLPSCAGQSRLVYLPSANRRLIELRENRLARTHGKEFMWADASEGFSALTASPEGLSRLVTAPRNESFEPLKQPRARLIVFGYRPMRSKAD